jgi:hypothetical protein
MATPSHEPRKATSKAVRTATSKTAAATAKSLRIPITNVFDGNDYSAQILIGSQQVAANVILDTGSSTLAVVPSVYQAAKDADMKPTSLAQQVQYGTGAWVGPVVNTSLVLGDPAGVTVTLPGAPIALTVAQSEGDFQGVDGIMGLAYLSLNQAYNLQAYLTKQKVNPPVTFPWPFSSANFTNAWKQFAELISAGGAISTSIDPYFMALETQGLTMNKFAFYTLRSWVRVATNNKSAIAADPLNNGFFILGGGEEQADLYSGAFVNVDVTHDVYYNTNLISIQVDGCAAVKAKPLQAQYSGAGSNCIIDTGTNPLVLSNDVYQAVLQSLEKVNPKFISFILTGDTGQPVKLTCAPQTYWQEDYPAPGQSVFQIDPAGQNNPVNQSILGLPLMNNYYTVFDRSLGAGKGIIRFAAITQPS